MTNSTVNESVMKFNVPAVAGGGNIVAVVYEGKPAFPAVRMAAALGYSNPSKALKDHCKSLIKLNYNESLELKIGDLASVNHGLQLIGESDLYRLIMSSKLPSAVAFQDWIVEEVIPSINATGGYGATSKPEVTLTLSQARFDEMNDAIISMAKSMTRLAGVVTHVIESQDKRSALPATSADKWVDPRQDFTISELADMLNCQPWNLRQRLIKDKAITSQGERAWKPVPAMIAKGYCEDVAKIGWKFTRKGAQAIIKHYTETLA